MVWVLLVLSLMPLSPPVEARAVRSEIEMVLAEMRRSALAGDPVGYLSHVAMEEPRFAMEMTNWAKDLAANRPVLFDLRIVEEGAVFEPSRAEFALEMDYSVAVVADPADRSVVKRAAFPTVIFEKDAGGAWRYLGEKWSVLEGDGFEVRYTGDFEGVARMVVEAFPVAREHVDRGFEIPGTGHQIIKLYADMEHLKATVYLSMPDPHLGGWNEAGESIKFLTRYAATVAGWTRAFAHEYGHVATWEMGPKAGEMDWWVQEGVAELAAEDFDDGRQPGTRAGNDGYIRSRARAGTLVPWEAIASYRTAEQSVKYQAYAQGHHFIGYISDRWGRSGRNRWLRSMAAGKSVNQATRDRLNTEFSDLDREWRESLGAPDVQEGPE